MNVLAALLLPLLALCSSLAAVRAADSNPAAVFAYSSTQGLDNNVVWALNVNNATGDLYFHLAASSDCSWVAVGLGSQMKGATMFVAYASSNGTGVTISPRIASGHTEPSYHSGLTIEKLYDDGLPDANTADVSRGSVGNIVVDAVCRDCLRWLGPDLDLASTTQPFIFALGPPFPFTSDSVSAGLTQHMFHGQFTMDMTKAVSGSGGAVPQPPYTTTHASAATNTQNSSDPAPVIHGVIMSLVFIFLLPIGSLVLRVWNKVRGHAIVQCLALLLFCMAFAGGSVVSTKYNRTKNFDQGHQILGILLLVALFAQLALGVVNHRIFKRTQRGTIMGKIHLFLGPGIIFFGWINGGLGFRLAGMPYAAIPYVILIILVVIGYCAIRFGLAFLRNRRKTREQEQSYQIPQFGNAQAPYGVPGEVGYVRGGDGAGRGGNGGSFPYSAPPPAYNSSVRIPLSPYGSSQSVPHAGANGGHAVEPRQMI